MRTKRRRALTNPLEVANQKTDDQFIVDYFRPNDSTASPWKTSWVHPRTGKEYTISLLSSGNLTDGDLQACFELIAETSQHDYEESTLGWHPSKKLKEMKSPDLRYILVKDESRSLFGFTSLMPTFEDGEPVVYCYEIHLKPDLQGTGLGKLLMSLLATVAENVPPIKKVMLTCFLSNQRGLDFYKRLGFEEDEISPRPRKLRFGKTLTPDHIILSKAISRDLVALQTQPPSS